MGTSKKFTDYQLRVLETASIDCLDIARLMGDFHDQELPHTLKGRLNSHISECKYCHQLYASYAFTVKLASELHEQTIPSGVKLRLRAALNKNLGLNLELHD